MVLERNQSAAPETFFAQGQMTWQPNRRQWWAISAAYIGAALINYDQFDLSGWTSNNPQEYWTAFLVVGAALVVWRLQR